MVGAKIIPFPTVGGVNAPPRPVPPFAGGAGFAGMMDDALGASSQARRDDAVRSAPAPRPRRPEAVKPRANDTHAATASRRTASAARKPAADRADDTERDEKSARTGDRPGEAVPVEAAASLKQEDPAAKTAAAAGDAAEQCAAADAAASEAAAAAVEAAAVAVAGPAGLSAAEGDEAGNAGPSTAVLPGTPATGEEAGEAKEAAAGIRGRTSAANTGLPGQTGANRSASAQAEAAETSGEPLVELAAEGVEGAREDAAAPAALRLASPVTDTGAPSGAKAKEADAAAAFAEAVAEVEAVADTDSSGGADVADAGTQDQLPPRQAPGTAGQAAHAVAAAHGASDGVRFSVNLAAGSAAYASAAPRPEEAVLPQIVQSIRLQTTQGMSEARVQLRPEHLGTLNITLKVENGQVTATIQAGVAAVRQWIESNESSLRQALSEQGLQLTRLVVQPDDEQADQQGLDQGDTRRQPQRRSWRDEDVTFEVLV